MNIDILYSSTALLLKVYTINLYMIGDTRPYKHYTLSKSLHPFPPCITVHKCHTNILLPQLAEHFLQLMHTQS